MVSGPTHDDITYSCLAKAFDQPLERHEETLRRMTAFAAEKYDLSKQTAEQTSARELMGTLPSGKRSEVLFVESQKWVVRPCPPLLPDNAATDA